MKILSEKKSICTTMKVLYSRDEDYYCAIRQMKNEGWKVATKPDYYNDRKEMVIKSAPNGVIITYIRYDRM